MIKPNELEKTVSKSIDWINDNNLQDRTMHIYQAHYYSAFDGDKFNDKNSKVKEGLYSIRNRENPHESIKSGELFIWDGKVSPNEGGLPIDNVDTNYFRELVELRPENEFDVYNAGKYYIKIFKRK